MYRIILQINFIPKLNIFVKYINKKYNLITIWLNTNMRFNINVSLNMQSDNLT